MKRSFTVRKDAKKVLIIGASSGIGRELARIYAEKGHRVGITGRRKELLISLQDKYPQNIVVESFDVTGKVNIPHLRNIIEQLDGLDVVVYNSGYGEVSEDLDWEIEKQTTEINVNGFIEIMCYAFNYLKNQGHGSLACTSSIASIKGNPGAPAYSASKAFESIYMEGLYLKARKLKIPLTITDIQPGFVDTGMAKSKGKFWVSDAAVAAEQMYAAIEAGKRRVYITRRWTIIAWILRCIPFWIYKRFT